eukprot:7377644-Prymnesium_polylepis.1
MLASSHLQDGARRRQRSPPRPCPPPASPQTRGAIAAALHVLEQSPWRAASPRAAWRPPPPDVCSWRSARASTRRLSNSASEPESMRT